MNNSKYSSAQAMQSRTIFIGGLPGASTEAQIRGFFSRFGSIEKIKMYIGQRKTDRHSRGYAILQFQQESSCHAALKRPEYYLFDRVIMCQPYLQGKELNDYLEDLNSRRLFVKYIPYHINNNQFEKFFCRFGEVDFGYVVKDPRTKRSRGFGYITFKSPSIARKVAQIESIRIGPSKKLKIFEYRRRGAQLPNDIHSHKRKEDKLLSGQLGGKTSKVYHQQQMDTRHQFSDQLTDSPNLTSLLRIQASAIGKRHYFPNICFNISNNARTPNQLTRLYQTSYVNYYYHSPSSKFFLSPQQFGKPAERKVNNSGNNF